VARIARRRFLVSAAALALGACAQPSVIERPAPASRRSANQADVNGTRLYYEDAGTGDPVVLIHGFTLDTRMWDDQFDVLARDFRVIRYDARGYGRSAVPRKGEPYSHVDDLDQLLARLSAEQSHLVGFSMGGRFALDYAVTHPTKVRSLIVIDSVVGGWEWSKEWLASYAPIVEAGKRNDIARAKALWLAHPLFAPAREKPAVAARLRQMVDHYSGWHFDLVNSSAERTVTPPTVTQLAKIRVPTLALVGERDLPDFQRIAETIARDVPNARRAVIAGAGHMANMEAADAVNPMVQDFLRRVAAAARA
jgi:3-oxoadipate enol-lactonase